MSSHAPLSGEFVGEFGPRYQRNNKRSGMKNLRCFPVCGERGHRTSGFCGRFLDCRMRGLAPAQLGPREELRVWGGFTMCGGGGGAGGDEQEFTPGQRVPRLAVVAKERTRAHPFRPWIRGELAQGSGGSAVVVPPVADGDARVLFNRQQLGWHYQWPSTKHTCDSYHRFSAFVFLASVDDPQGDLTFLGVVGSPPFQLYSRRRQAAMAEVKDQEARERALAAGGGGGSLDPRKRGVDGLMGDDGFGRPLAMPSLPPKKRMLVELEQLRKRRERTLVVDRVMRLMLTHTGETNFSSMASSFQQYVKTVKYNQVSDEVVRGFSADPNGMSSTASSSSSATMEPPGDVGGGGGTGTFPHPAAPQQGRTTRGLGLRHVSSTLTGPSATMLGDQSGGAGPGPGPGPGQAEAEAENMSDFVDTMIGLLGESDTTDYPDSGHHYTNGSNGNNSSSYRDEAPAPLAFGDMTDVDFDLLIEQTLKEGDSSSSDGQTPRSRSSTTASQGGVSSTASEPPKCLGDDIGVDLLSKLKMVILEKGSPALRAQADEVHRVMSQLADSIIFVASNRRDFENFIARWSSSRGVATLKAQFLDEQVTSKMPDGFVNEAEEEIEDGGGDNGAYKSIYAEVRNLFRNVLLDALGRIGGDLDQLQEPMELAAKHRLLNVDPLFPPSKRVAALTHLQLLGHVKALAKQDFGSRRNRFASDQQRVEWTNAYWRLRRKVFRRLIVGRIIEERKGCSYPPRAPPVLPGWEGLEGTWFNCRATDNEQSKQYAQLTERVGLKLGDLSAKLFLSMWKKMTIKLNQAAMFVQGDKVLLANPSTTFFLDKRPRSYLMPNPLPVAAWSLERHYIAWLAITPDGRHVVNIVQGGPTRSTYMNQYLDSKTEATMIKAHTGAAAGASPAAASSDPAAAPTAADAPVADSAAEENEREDNESIRRNSEARVAKQYYLAPDRETLFMSHRVHFFDNTSAPRFDDVQALEKLLEPGLPSEVAFSVSKFIKVFSSELPDDLFDLLIG